MRHFFTPETRTCPEIGLPVLKNLSEAECRAQHGCEQKHCPIKNGFSPESVDFQLETRRVLGH